MKLQTIINRINKFSPKNNIKTGAKSLENLFNKISSNRYECRHSGIWSSKTDVYIIDHETGKEVFTKEIVVA